MGNMSVKPEPSPSVRAEVSKAFPQKRFVWLTQEHTQIVLPAEEACGRIADGLVTNDNQTLLGITVADCLPIFLWDTATGARAVCHSGWKGTGIVHQAINMMKARYGARPETIHAILGPGIRACCYAVPEERASFFATEFGQETAFKRGGQWYMDLAAANKNILSNEGIQAIHTHAECTCCDTRFSSYRRQGENFSLMLAVFGV